MYCGSQAAISMQLSFEITIPTCCGNTPVKLQLHLYSISKKLNRLAQFIAINRGFIFLMT